MAIPTRPTAPTRPSRLSPSTFPALADDATEWQWETLPDHLDVIASFTEAKAATAESAAQDLLTTFTDYSGDVDSLVDNGIFKIATGVTNAWDGASTNDFLFNLYTDVSNQVQYGYAASGETHIRSKEYGTWGAWGTHRRWDTQKHLLSADWQPRDASEVTRIQGVMDSIAGRHPDLSHGHVLGDLIDEGSVDTTGADPIYTFADFLADWDSRLGIPRSRSFFIPGNHDRDGTGATLHEKAWTMKSYRSFIGPEYYYTLQGNLMIIYMGDMGGTTGGVITNTVTDWAEILMKANKDKNIILAIHHPLSGTYQGQTEGTNPTNVQLSSTRITDALDDITADVDNVAAVFYGHVGSANQFNDETFHGTRHLQIGMHMPSNVDNARNDHYYVMGLVDGASSISIEQWDATGDSLLSTKTVTLTYPLSLAPEFTFNGLKDEDKLTPGVLPIETMVPVDNWRYDNAGSWDLPATTQWIHTIGSEDRSLDDIENGFGIGYGVKFPGATVSGTDYDDAALAGVAVEGLGIAWVNKNGVDVLADVYVNVKAAENGVVSDAFWASTTGVHAGHDSTTTTNPGNVSGTVGASLNSGGYVSCFRAGITGYFGRDTDGDVMEFNKNGTRGGVITITGATVAYTTSSDIRLKTDMRSFNGLDILGGIKVYDFEWIDGGRRSHGVMAQELVEVLPEAVRVGGDDLAKDPWSVDYSKIVPVLIKAVQELQGKVEVLESKLNNVG